MSVSIEGLELFQLREVAKRFSCSERTVRNYLKYGRLSGQKFAGHWYVTGDSLKQFFTNGNSVA